MSMVEFDPEDFYPGHCAESRLHKLLALKKEPETQAHRAWARDIISKVIIPPADSTDSGEGK